MTIGKIPTRPGRPKGIGTMLETFDRRHRTIKVDAVAGQPYTLDIMPELYLFLAVVTQARMDARSKCSRIKWEARSFLRALDLPVNGPATIRITRAKKLAIRDET